MALRFKDRVEKAKEYGFVRVSRRLLVRPDTPERGVGGIAHLCTVEAAIEYERSHSPLEIGGWVWDQKCAICSEEIDEELLKRCKFVADMMKWK